jgi:hypothetical protein
LTPSSSHVAPAIIAAYYIHQICKVVLIKESDQIAFLPFLHLQVLEVLLLRAMVPYHVYLMIESDRYIKKKEKEVIF